MVLRVEQGKGMKDRYVMLSPKLLQILRESGGEWKGPSTGSFPALCRASTSAALRLSRSARKSTEFAKFPNPSPRIPCGTPSPSHLLEQGTDVRTIQLLLGHRSLSTTAKYLRIATSKVCSTSSPLDLLPHPVPLEVKPTPPPLF